MNKPSHWTRQSGVLLLAVLVLPTACSKTTPLHDAVRQGDWEAVGLLIKKGADVNAVIRTS